MKIIILGPGHPLRGGIANFNEALCRELNNQGHNTTIYSFCFQYPSILFPGKTQYDSNSGPQDIEIEQIIHSVNPLNWIKVSNKIKKETPDLVIIRYWLPFMGPCLGSIARLIRKHTKVIAITDNVIPHEKRPGDKWFTSYFAKSCHGFIAMSKSVLNDLSQFTENSNKLFLPHPIYNIFGDSVDKASARNNLQLNKEGKYLLFFGFIRRYKGLDLLLEAMAAKEVREIGVKLIVAGEYYGDEAYYEKIIKKLDIDNQLILNTNYISSDDVKHYFCAADMVVQPYRSATQSGITQIAYHFERPMLVTNTGGLPEIVTDGKVGYVVDVNSIDISNAIIDFYKNNKEDEFSQNTKHEKKRFQWSSFVDGLMKLVSSL